MAPQTHDEEPRTTAGDDDRLRNLAQTFCTALELWQLTRDEEY
jgi:hypothetical protein